MTRDEERRSSPRREHEVLHERKVAYLRRRIELLTNDVDPEKRAALVRELQYEERLARDLVRERRRACRSDQDDRG